MLGSGLKQTIISDGVWRIRRRERSPVIEVFKLEETGYGDILSQGFVNWRTKTDEEKANEVQAAKARLLGAINENGSA